MINTRRTINIIFACWIIFLFSVIASHGVLTLETDHDEIFIQKQVTLSNNVKKRETIREENSNFRNIWQRIEKFLNDKINDYGINKERNELVIKDNEINQLRSNKIESEINLNDWTKFFSIFTKNDEIFKRLSNSNEKLTNKINQNINEENDSNDLTLIRNVRSINRTDYYAQRKAVMDKFHARQREITTKYRTQYLNNTSRIAHKNNQTLNEMTRTFKNTNNSNLDTFNVASNNSFFGELNIINHEEKVTEKKRSRINDNSIRDITNYTSQMNNKIRQNEENTERKKSWIGDNSLRDVINYTSPTNHNCTNLIVHGTYSKHARNQLTVSCWNNQNELIDRKPNEPPPSRPIRATDGNLIWGTCNGTLVYEHNFSLNIKGPSILEAIFEIIVDGPFCISCIMVLPYNQTKENALKESGGQGFNYVKIRFSNSDNQGFSYRIKIWAVAKTDDNCA